MKVNDVSPCQLVYGPPVSIKGLPSGAHKITVNIVPSLNNTADGIAVNRHERQNNTQYYATVLASDTVLVDVPEGGLK